ncbi:hypothetical protein SUGI_0855520 [Cryptomeria japonica]|nr:hypothetical protein SUGI_0855520 [Cryptomeria japonica]
MEKRTKLLIANKQQPLTSAKTKDFQSGGYIRAEGLERSWDIRVTEDGVVAEGNDWGLDDGELWISKDGCDIEDIAAGPTHVRCGLECPVVASASMARNMKEVVENESSYEEGFG